MKYTDVVQLMKQAVDFDAALAAQAKARQQQIARANSKYTQTTGKQPVISNAQANQIIDDSVRRRVAADAAKRKVADIRYKEFIAEQRAQNQSRAARTNATIARQEAADKAKRQAAMNPQQQTRPDTLHASPSTGGKRMQAVEEARRQDNRDFAIRDAARQDAALRAGTAKTTGSGSAGNIAYGQPIQRDANGQVANRAPAANAKVVRQSMINGMVYDHYADGTTKQNQALTEQYATTGQKPTLMKQPVQQRRPAAKPANTRPATTAQPATRPVTTQTTVPVQGNTTRINTSFNTGPASRLKR